MRHMPAVLHGSFRYADIFEHVRTVFTEAGIDVVAPGRVCVASYDREFPRLETDDPARSKFELELEYLYQVVSSGGFSYFINPDRRLGRTASAELGVAVAHGIRIFTMEELTDPPIYIPTGSIWKPEDLAGYVKKHGRLPEYDSQHNRGLQKILGSLAKPLVSVGGVIVDAELLDRPDPDVLLMRSPDWTDRYTVVGERIKSGQGLSEALESTIHEKTGLTPKLGKHIITFDEQSDDPDSKGRIFVDHAVLVRGNLRPERTTGCRYGWVSLSAALGEIDLEPNARRTLELYASSLDRI